MAPFTAWLPAQSNAQTDLILRIAGEGIAGLTAGLHAFEQALAEQGFEVLVEQGRLSGMHTHSIVGLRVSSDGLTSMGHGCDVFACLDEDLLRCGKVGLQRGSVFLGEPETLSKFRTAGALDGLITYEVPFRALCQRLGDCFSGKGLVALGVLSSLLDIPADGVRRHLQSDYSRRYFERGVAFGAEKLIKRDIFTLPPLSSSEQRVMLTAQQAMLLGLAKGIWRCGSECRTTLEQCPKEWVELHVAGAKQVVSVSREFLSYEAYFQPQSDSIGLVGVENPIALVAAQTTCASILVASDVVDILNLLDLAGRHRVRTPAYIVADGILAKRAQSVPLHVLRRLICDEAERGSDPSTAGDLFKPTREGDPAADVGYLAWGTTQGVVHEAVALCTKFGLKAAACYPKALWPLPTPELEAFASSVKGTVIVEPNAKACYSRLVRSATSLQPFSLRPEHGEELTPLTIFMNESLGIGDLNQRS